MAAFASREAGLTGNFIHLQKGHVFPPLDWPVWAERDMWAPEIHFVNEEFHVYFAARDREDQKLKIGCAISSTGPWGPYQDIGFPFIYYELGAIDVHWFKDPK